MKKQQFVAAIYVLFIGLFIFLFSYHALPSITGNLLIVMPPSLDPDGGSIFKAPTSCSGTWTNCSKGFGDDSLFTTESVGASATKFVRFKNFNFSDYSSILNNSRITNVTVYINFLSSNKHGFFNVKLSGDGGNTYGQLREGFGGNTAEQIYRIDATNDLNWNYNMLKNENFGIEIGCYKSGSGNNPTCKIDYVMVLVNYSNFDFTTSLNPVSITMQQGSSASTILTASFMKGISKDVYLDYTCPPSSSCAFVPSAGSPTFSSTFTISTSPITPLGTYTLYLARRNTLWPLLNPASKSTPLQVIVIPPDNARITQSCSLSDTLFRTSAQLNGLVSLFDDQNYPYKVCYPEAGPISRSCSVPLYPNTDWNLFMINKTDNKVYTYDTANYQIQAEQFTNVCASGITCYYEDSEAACNSNSTCLFSLTNKSAGIIGECNAYPVKACCAIYDKYVNDPCSTYSLNDVCGQDQCTQDADNDSAYSYTPVNTISVYSNSGIISFGNLSGNTTYTLSTWSRNTTYGCDLFPNDGCSINTVADNCKPGCGPDLNLDGIADVCQQPVITNQTCQIINSTWSSSSAFQGQPINLIVTTTPGCNGLNASFVIQEVDLLSNDNVNINPSVVKVNNGQAIGNWIAEYQDDGVGDPEYQFQVSIGILSYTNTAQLTVQRSSSANPSCGNSRIDSGETCQTCNKDAGCLNGTVCCLSSSTASCSSTCNTNNTNNTIINQGCLPGLTNINSTCSCIINKDGICPKDLTCFKVDKDCDDGDSIAPEDDNCPRTKNNDQKDFDKDATPLAKCFFTQDAYYITSDSSDYLCGGDSCDFDADNDRICDSQGPLEPYCIGQDQCLFTPLSSTVDMEPGENQGCSAEEVTCKVEWDCSNVAWNSCDSSTGLRNRDLGDCSQLGIQNGLCKCNKYPDANSDCTAQSIYVPKTMEKCENVQQQEFPFFDNLNLIITLILLSGFYLIRKKL